MLAPRREGLGSGMPMLRWSARRRQDGFVLVSVLWIVALIASLSALFVNVIGSHQRANSAYIRAAQAEAAADGAIRFFAFLLASIDQSRPGAASPTDGRWMRCRLASGARAAISIQDQDGLVDLNRAPLSLLRTVLVSQLGSPEGARLAGRIADIRRSGLKAASDDRDPGLHGAAEFQTVEELLAITDVDRPSLNRALRLLTVYSRSDGIDPRAAPRELRDALRASYGEAGPSPELVRESRARVFSITADVGDRSIGRSIRRAVVELIRQPDQPFAIREVSTVNIRPEDMEQELSGRDSEGSDHFKPDLLRLCQAVLPR